MSASIAAADSWPREGRCGACGRPARGFPSGRWEHTGRPCRARSQTLWRVDDAPVRAAVRFVPDGEPLDDTIAGAREVLEHAS